MPLMTRHASRRPQAPDFPAGHGSRFSSCLKAPRAFCAGALLLSCHLLPQIALAQQAGAQHYVTKPLDVRELLTLVDDLLMQAGPKERAK